MNPRTSRKHRFRFHPTLVAWASAIGICTPSGAAVQARIFEIGAPSPLYTYKLDSSREGSVDTWNARILDAQAREYATENTVTQDGKLVRYTLFQPQIGEEAEVKKIPKGVVFRYLKDGKWREDWEETSQEVITGPQLVGVVLRHWDPIVTGKPYDVRFAVPDRLETFGFRFQLDKSDAQSTVVRFIPSSFFIRQFVQPVVLTFETATKKIQKLQGPTFLKKKVGDKWHELHAEVRFD